MSKQVYNTIFPRMRFCLWILLVLIIVITPTGIVVARQNYQVGDTHPTDTVMVLDVSGSMEEYDASGLTKIEAAKNAATSIVEVIEAENSLYGYAPHQVGLVSFESVSRIESGITTDLGRIRVAIDNMRTGDMTAMAAGLNDALNMIEPVSTGGDKFIILMSDGLPNVGLGTGPTTEDELLDLARRANSGGICIHTVGFGEPGYWGFLGSSMDEDLLKQISAESGCGNYYNAENALDLASIFVKIRHESTGDILLESASTINQNQTVNMDPITVPVNQEFLLFTVNTLASQLDLIIRDPLGTLVDNNYPNANLNVTSALSSLAVSNPMAGNWDINIVGKSIPGGEADYRAIVSSRVGQTPTQTLQTEGSGGNAMGLFIAFGLVFIFLMAIIIANSSSNKKPEMQNAYLSDQAVLIGQNGAMTGQGYPISRNLVIGRGPNVQLQLSDLSVSLTHAQIYWVEGGWFIRDVGSRTGTYVNEQLIQATRLQPGDKIRIGPYIWIIQNR